MSEHKAIGLRLRAWRLALGKKPVTLVRESHRHHETDGLGRFDANFWSQWESGRRRISVNHAIALRRRYPGLTLDYIYVGDMRDMGKELREAIRDQRRRMK